MFPAPLRPREDRLSAPGNLDAEAESAFIPATRTRRADGHFAMRRGVRRGRCDVAARARIASPASGGDQCQFFRSVSRTRSVNPTSAANSYHASAFIRTLLGVWNQCSSTLYQAVSVRCTPPHTAAIDARPPLAPRLLALARNGARLTAAAMRNPAAAACRRPWRFYALGERRASHVAMVRVPAAGWKCDPTAREGARPDRSATRPPAAHTSDSGHRTSRKCSLVTTGDRDNHPHSRPR